MYYVDYCGISELGRQLQTIRELSAFIAVRKRVCIILQVSTDLSLVT